MSGGGGVWVGVGCTRVLVDALMCTAAPKTARVVVSARVRRGTIRIKLKPTLMRSFFQREISLPLGEDV